MLVYILCDMTQFMHHGRHIYWHTHYHVHTYVDGSCVRWLIKKKNVTHCDLSSRDISTRIYVGRLAFTWVDSHLCKTFMWVFKISDIWWHLETLHIDSRLCFTFCDMLWYLVTFRDVTSQNVTNQSRHTTYRIHICIRMYIYIYIYIYAHMHLYEYI